MYSFYARRLFMQYCPNKQEKNSMKNENKHNKNKTTIKSNERCTRCKCNQIRCKQYHTNLLINICDSDKKASQNNKKGNIHVLKSAPQEHTDKVYGIIQFFLFGLMEMAWPGFVCYGLAWLSGCAHGSYYHLW